MVRKCSVGYCRTGYDLTKGEKQLRDARLAAGEKVDDVKISVFKFPDDESECKRWLAALPNKIEFKDVTRNIGVCSLHFSPDCPHKINPGGSTRPAVPPSIFNSAPPSTVPSTVPAPRCTTRAQPSVHNQERDQLDAFRIMDTINQKNFATDVQVRYTPTSFDYIQRQNKFYMFSSERDGPTSNWTIEFTQATTLNFAAFVKFQRIFIPKNLLTDPRRITKWSELDAVISFLKNFELTSRSRFLSRQIELNNIPSNGAKVYQSEDLALGFQFYCMSTKLYSELRAYLRLPSLRLIRSITSTTAKLDQTDFLSNVFNKLEARQRMCVVLIDEIYVRPSIQYHGGTIFGKAMDNPNEQAKTVLAVMIRSLFGGPHFVIKLVPCARLNGEFQKSVIDSVFLVMKSADLIAIGLVGDNSSVNQKTFDLFAKPDPLRPWIAASIFSPYPLFLLNDTIHLDKSIRNNFVTEKCQTLEYYDFEVDSSVIRQSKWHDLVQLHKDESSENDVVACSALTKDSVAPTSFKKQNVKLALNVIDDKTIAALKISPLDKDGHTARFLELWARWYKMVSIRTATAGKRFNDKDREPFSSTDDERLTFLRHMAKLFAFMGSLLGRPRIRSLTPETSRALERTTLCLVDLISFLLTTDGIHRHDYVLTWCFTTDLLEAYFGQTRQAFGGCFYVSTQQIEEFCRISNARLLALLDALPDVIVESKHECSNCSLPLEEDDFEVIDTLPLLVDELSRYQNCALVYIAGYITFKLKLVVDDKVSSFTEYLDAVNRGKLTTPSKDVFIYVCMCYCFFCQVVVGGESKFCRTRLMIAFDFVGTSSLSDSSVQFPEKMRRILANIFLNNNAKKTIDSDIQEAQKRAKFTASTVVTRKRKHD